MAITKKTVIKQVRVQDDGQVIVYEATEFWEGGTVNGVLEATSPVRGRVIDVGDPVAAEDALIKDIVNGNLHSAERKSARDAAKIATGVIPE